MVIGTQGGGSSAPARTWKLRYKGGSTEGGQRLHDMLSIVYIFIASCWTCLPVLGQFKGMHPKEGDILGDV